MICSCYQTVLMLSCFYFLAEYTKTNKISLRISTSEYKIETSFDDF